MTKKTWHTFTWGLLLIYGFFLIAGCGGAATTAATPGPGTSAPATPSSGWQSVTVSPQVGGITPTPKLVQPEGTELTDYRGHSDLVSALAWSPDGNMIASGSNDQSVQVWNAQTGQHVATYHGHSDTVTGIAWSPDGRYIASVQENGYDVHIWDSQTGQLAFLLHDENGAMLVAWSPDGNYVASGAAIISIWNIRTRALVVSTPRNSDYFRHLAWSPNGVYLAGSTDGKVIEVWNALNGKIVYTYRGHRGTINNLAWSPDSTRIVSASEDKTAQVWDATNGQHVLVHSITGESVYGIRDVIWSPDGSSIASIDALEASNVTPSVTIWNAVNGKVLFARQKTEATVLAWSPDGSRMADDNGNDVEIWQVGKATHKVSSPPPAKQRPVITSGTGRLIESYSLGYWANSVVWSPDGKRLAAASASGNITIWDVASRAVLRTLSGSGLLSAQAWSPDGSHLAGATSAGDVVIWNTTTGEATTTCTNTTTAGALNAVAWSPDGKQLALASSQTAISLCNVATGQITYTYTPDVTPDLTGGYYSVSWSPDSKEIAFGGSDGELTIMDVASKRVVKSYIAATIIYTVNWSHNGYFVACGGYGSAIVAIHPGDAGNQSISFSGDTGATVEASSWSPNGQYLASATSSGLVQIGSMASKRIIFTYTTHLSTVHDISWSPDGHTMASVDHDGNVEVWQAPL